MDIGGHQGSPGSHWGHWWTLVDIGGHLGSLQGSTMAHLGSLGVIVMVFNCDNGGLEIMGILVVLWAI